MHFIFADVFLPSLEVQAGKVGHFVIVEKLLHDFCPQLSNILSSVESESGGIDHAPSTLNAFNIRAGERSKRIRARWPRSGQAPTRSTIATLWLVNVTLFFRSWRLSLSRYIHKWVHAPWFRQAPYIFAQFENHLSAKRLDPSKLPSIFQ